MGSRFAADALPAHARCPLQESKQDILGLIDPAPAERVERPLDVVYSRTLVKARARLRKACPRSARCCKVRGKKTANRYAADRPVIRKVPRVR